MKDIKCRIGEVILEAHKTHVLEPLPGYKKFAYYHGVCEACAGAAVCPNYRTARRVKNQIVIPIEGTTPPYDARVSTRHNGVAIVPSDTPFD